MPTDTIYTVTGSELTSIADAIRTKGDTSASLAFPSGFVEAIGDISGGSGQLYIFTNDSAWGNTSATIGTTALTARKVYYSPSLVSGATVTFLTFNDYILDYIRGWDSGNTYSFTTVSRGEYTFTMPNESVECALLYDD